MKSQAFFVAFASAVILANGAVTASSADPSSLAFDLGGAVGRWHAPNGSTVFEFQKDGSIKDNLHVAGRGRNSSSLLRGSNLAVTYAENKACYYRAFLSADRMSLFLAERPPKTPGWLCFTGLLVKSN